MPSHLPVRIVYGRVLMSGRTSNASLASRASAFLVDVFLLIIFSLPINSLFLYMLVYWVEGLTDELTLPVLLFMSLFILGIIVSMITLIFLYFVLLEKRYGQTLGKKIVGLRVVSSDGSPLTWKQVLVRNITKMDNNLLILDTLLGWFVIDSTKGGRAFDYLVGTKVVRV